MRHKIVLLFVVLGLALPATASFAAEHDSTDAKPDVQKDVKPKAKKKVKPHSHLEEKIGIPAKSPDQAMPEADGADAAAKQQHSHQRAMK